MSTTPLFLSIIVVTIIVAGITVLQIYLSKMVSKWPGLILPIIFIILSIINVCGLTFLERKTVIHNIIRYATTFILNNIPTIILLGIYFPYRQDHKKRVM